MHNGMHVYNSYTPGDYIIIGHPVNIDFLPTCEAANIIHAQRSCMLLRMSVLVLCMSCLCLCKVSGIIVGIAAVESPNDCSSVY